MGNEVERLYDVGVAGIHRLLANRGTLARARVVIVCAGMEGATAQRSRRIGWSSCDRGSYQHRLRSCIQGRGGVARNDEFLRFERQRGQH